MTKLTRAEWMKLGTELFGPDLMNWRFRCPRCGHVATVKDFAKFKTVGATPEHAYCQCIGRYLPKDQRGGWSASHSNPSVKQPCDYAAYGLIGLSPVRVITEDDKEIDVFDFDRTTGQQEHLDRKGTTQ